MRILFVHQNFPGQYLHLARYLAAQPDNEVVFMTQRQDGEIPNVRKIVYTPHRKVSPEIHHYIRETENGVINAQSVARTALNLKEKGFVPDVMLGHNGWGEIWYLKDVFPNTPLIGYFEFYYQYLGADVGFDPNENMIFDTAPRIRTKNIGNLLALDTVDMGQCPTRWQHSLYPTQYQPVIRVIHEGIDTDIAVPNPDATLKLSTGKILSQSDEVITYVSRNLEPYRGFPSLMRSLPKIQAEKPNAEIIIVGGDETSYGPASPTGDSYRKLLLDELSGSLNTDRIHFQGKVPYPTFLKILQISRVHIYLTFPFVLSWSMLEAMSCGCIVVGSRTEPVTEVIEHKKNGLLVDFFSPDEIANTVIEVLNEKDSIATIKTNARQTIIDNYDLKRRCLPEQIKLIEDAINMGH